MPKKKKIKFDVGKEVRAIARERIGRVKSSKTIKSKKDKADRHPPDLLRSTIGLKWLGY